MNSIFSLAKTFAKTFFSLNITGASFFVALSILLIFYYALPQKKRWTVFAAANALFVYGAAGKGKFALLCVAFMTIATWLFSLALLKRESSDEKKTFESKSESEKCKNCRVRKAMFLAAVFFDILILIFLKDAKFFARIFGVTLSENFFSATKKICPAGISYWTLSLVSYLFDAYKNETPPQKNFFRFFSAALFFPLLVSGPILRISKNSNSILKGNKFSYENFCFGAQKIVWGVFKKIVVADRLALFVSKVFDSPVGTYAGFYIWISAAAFFVQLYADFSGCIDIALGAAELFGIHLPKNFDLPFFSKSVAEFWRRWHITLGAFLRDFVYIPLGGNRKGKLKKYFNIALVFLVSGFWHGGAVKFLAWGFLHAIFQIAGDATFLLRKKLCQKFCINRESFSFGLWQCCAVFFLCCFAWIFFRAPSFKSALLFLKNAFSFNPWIFFDGSLFSFGLDKKNFRFLSAGIFAMCVAGVVKKVFGSTKNFLKGEPLFFRAVLNVPLVLLIVLSLNLSTQEFLYGAF